MFTHKKPNNFTKLFLFSDIATMTLNDVYPVFMSTFHVCVNLDGHECQVVNLHAVTVRNRAALVKESTTL